MPAGKPAGVRCVQLTEDLRCAIFGRADRPEVCGRLRPMPDMCGASTAEAMANIARLEAATSPPCATEVAAAQAIGCPGT